MSNHVSQFLDMYAFTFVKIFMYVDTSHDISVTLNVRVSLETEKAEGIIKSILKHRRSSHRSGIHQSVHLNKSILGRLFLTLSRLRGTTGDPWSYQRLWHNSMQPVPSQWLSSCCDAWGVRGRELRVKVHCFCRQLFLYYYFWEADSRQLNCNPWVRKWIRGAIVIHGSLFTIPSSHPSPQILANASWQDSSPFSQLLETRGWGWSVMKSLRRTVWSRKQSFLQWID